MHNSNNLCRTNTSNKPIHFLIIMLLSILLIFFFIIYINVRQIYKWEKKEKENIDRIIGYNNIYNIETSDSRSDYSSNNNDVNMKIDNDNISYKNNYGRTIYDINNNIHNENTNNISIDPDEDCIIEIPDINLYKIIYTGKSREKHLDKYELVTATDDMKYCQGGNYIICGHASRLYGHSLNRIKEIKNGTIIYIWHQGKMDHYTVNDVFFTEMKDTDKYCEQNNSKIITIVSCAKYISYNSYIVIKAIPK